MSWIALKMLTGDRNTFLGIVFGAQRRKARRRRYLALASSGGRVNGTPLARRTRKDLKHCVKRHRKGLRATRVPRANGVLLTRPPLHGPSGHGEIPRSRAICTGPSCGPHPACQGTRRG